MDTDGPICYQITIGGTIDPGLADWLGALSMRVSTTDYCSRVTVLTCLVADQAALRGILAQIWDLNLELIGVERLGRHRDDAG